MASAIQELLALAKAQKLASLAKKNLPVAVANTIANTVPATVPEVIPEANPDIHTGIDRYGKLIEWNAEQWQFIQTVLSGKSCILIGAAGTGKTTTMQGAISQLLLTKYFPPMQDDMHKHLPTGTPGIIGVSFTKTAVKNLRRAMPNELKDNCINIHQLLEYQPVFYEVIDADGLPRKTMKFEPSRNQFNKLSSAIKIIIIDESSMVAVDLVYKIYCALPDPSKVAFIYLGDIQQLPPIFGSAILGFKMLSLTTVELTQVYRQALESPIIRLLHRILSGVPIPASEYPAWEYPEKLKIHAWKKSISADNALRTIALFFKNAYDAGKYTPEDDMILIPFNKACGTNELNRHIANHIARKRGYVTYEIVAGYERLYFSVGEKVWYSKEDAEIVNIRINQGYSGAWPQPEHKYLDYWGTVQLPEGEVTEHHILNESEKDIDELLAGINLDDEERVREASHIVTIKILATGQELEVKTAAGLNEMILSYALTVHKSQGSEWKKVFLILHSSHNTMLQRELLYTGCSRAREELYIICEPDSFTKGIIGQRIKGHDLKAKAEFFKGKLERGEDELVAKLLEADER